MMLSVQSNTASQRYGPSLTEDPASGHLLARPRRNSDRCSDGLRMEAEAAPTVASMAAILLSNSPDLASSFFNEYFRMDNASETNCPKIISRKTAAKSWPSKAKPATYAKQESLDVARKKVEKEDAVDKVIVDKVAAEKVVDKDAAQKDASGQIARKSSLRPAGASKRHLRLTFADVNGLPLVLVKEFESVDYFQAMRDEIIQNSLPHATTDTSLASSNDTPSSTSSSSSSSSSLLLCDFPMPHCDYVGFREKLLRDQVCLESVLIVDHTVQGLVRVVNRVFEKRVFVRWTTDGWMTSKENRCRYVANRGGVIASSTSSATTKTTTTTDCFAFDIQVPTPIQQHDQIQFCLRFEIGPEGGEQQQHWDNNGGGNYLIVTDEFDNHRRSFLHAREEEKMVRTAKERGKPTS